ncbi:MAG: M48 family metalloprotease [Bacteroidota bacterium]
MVHKRVRFMLAASLLAVVIVTGSGCGRGSRLISRDEEIRMGRQAAVDFEKQSGGRDRDLQRNAITNAIGARVSASAVAGDYPDYPYEFRVLANDQVNANAFPGGIVYLWSGLFRALGNSEPQLAWVAGHEAAHVARQHTVRRMERALGYDLIIQIVLGKDTAGRVAQAVANLTLQNYGRDQELEADRVGAIFSKQAGYDPTAALAVLETFKRSGGDPSNLELLFASHPGSNTREDNLKAFFRQQKWSGQYFKP